MQISHRLKHCTLLLALSVSLVTADAQRKKTAPPATPVKTDTTRKPPAVPPNRQGPKAYNEVITSKAISQKGLFGVHKVDDRWYFEIGDSLLGRDILVVNRISQAPINTRAGFNGYAGDEINENVIRFIKGPNNKIFLQDISFSVYSKDSTKPMFKSVQRSNIQPIAAAFDIKAFSKDSTGSVIDMTDFINSDNEILYFAPFFKNSLRLGPQQNDKSYIVNIRTYPINTEIRTVKTYSKTAAPARPGGAPAGPAGNATFHGIAAKRTYASPLLRRPGSLFYHRIYRF
jgi:hypothetical protein